MNLAAARFTTPAGVLFVEDFDEIPARADEHPEIIAPVYRAEDVEDAREEGRIAGAEEARADQEAIQTALCNAALAAIGDGLANARAAAALCRRIPARGEIGSRRRHTGIAASAPLPAASERDWRGGKSRRPDAKRCCRRALTREPDVQIAPAWRDINVLWRKHTWA